MLYTIQCYIMFNVTLHLIALSIFLWYFSMVADYCQIATDSRNYLHSLFYNLNRCYVRYMCYLITCFTLICTTSLSHIPTTYCETLSGIWSRLLTFYPAKLSVFMLSACVVWMYFTNWLVCVCCTQKVLYYASYSYNG